MMLYVCRYKNKGEGVLSAIQISQCIIVFSHIHLFQKQKVDFFHFFLYLHITV